MQTFHGHCSCGAVQYTIPNKIKNVVNCHCSICRKLTGGAFASYVIVDAADYRIEQGEESLAVYHKADSTAQKHFCKHCASPMFNTNPKYGDIKIIYLGTFAEGYDFVPRMNTYCSTRLDWLEHPLDIPNWENGRS